MIKDHVEVAWAIMAIRDSSELPDVLLSDEDVADRRYPRVPYKRVRRITLADKRGEASLTLDPYDQH